MTWCLFEKIRQLSRPSIPRLDESVLLAMHEGMGGTREEAGNLLDFEIIANGGSVTISHCGRGGGGSQNGGGTRIAGRESGVESGDQG